MWNGSHTIRDEHFALLLRNSADIDILRGGSIVTSVPGSEKATTISLDPGTYEVEAQSNGGATFVTDEFSVARVLCYRHPTELNDSALPDEKRAALLLFPHQGTRVWVGKGLTVPRLVADYGVTISTRVTWLKDGKERTTTLLGPKTAWKPDAIERPEYVAYARFAENQSHMTNACSSLFTIDHELVSFPPEVEKERGAWTARLVSPDASPIEVDFDLDHLVLDKRYGDAEPVDVFNPERHFGTVRGVRSMPLDRRTATLSTDDLAWLAQQDKAFAFVSDAERGEWHTGEPIPITPALFRAAYRSPALRLAFIDFYNARQAVGGTIDVGGSYQAGLARGETVTQIDANIASSQARLDANLAAENGARTSDVASLRFQIQSLTKKFGAPFKPEECPSL